jgi:hypothetical protein
MPHAQISSDGTWVRRIHELWENQSGWRTDIPQTVLDNQSVKRVLLVLDDTRGVFVPMEDIRRAVSTAPHRLNGMVGPFNVNPHNSTVNGFRIEMEIKYPKKQTG